MQVGMIGLGRMGANMVRRLMRKGHDCVVFDVSPDAVSGLVGEGSTGSGSLEEFVAALSSPRCICIMVPAAAVDATIASLSPLLESGDTIIDGGNSFYRDDIHRAEALAPQGIHYVDVGTSGGVFGLDRGFCLMIGGEDEAVARLEPIFASMAPGVDAATRTPGRDGDPTPAEQGYLHCGPAGAGHFVKMVHNGIEYGMMGAYAEGLNILERANIGAEQQEHDAETTPLREPEAYMYDLPIAEIAELWRRGSVVASWLLDLTAQALALDLGALRIRGGVVRFRRGALDLGGGKRGRRAGTRARGRTLERFASRGGDEFQNRVLSAMRYGFGGHVEKSTTLVSPQGRSWGDSVATMRSRTLVLAITTALPAGADEARHGHGHHDTKPPRSTSSSSPSTTSTGTSSRRAGPSSGAGGRGAAYLATDIRAARREPNTRGGRAGDLIGASPLLSALFHDEPTIEAMNLIGLDLSAVGNHEFDEGAAELLRMQYGGCHPVDGCQDGDGFAGADFDFLAANVVDDDTGGTLFPPYEITRVEGVKVAFIGMTLEGTPSDRDPVGRRGARPSGRGRHGERAGAGAPPRQGVEAIVVLLHEGGIRPRRRERLPRVSGPIVDIVGRLDDEVDVIVSGHTHQAYNCAHRAASDR